MKNLLLPVFLIFLSHSVLAAPSQWYKHYVNPVNLIFESQEDGSRAYIVFSESVATHCTGSNGSVRIYANTKKGEYMISSLLTAIVANKEILPLVTTDTCDDWNRPVLTGLRIK